MDVEVGAVNVEVVEADTLSPNVNEKLKELSEEATIDSPPPPQKNLPPF